MPTSQTIKAVLTLSLLIIGGLGFAQQPVSGPEQDCVNAIPVAILSNLHFPFYTGIGSSENEIDPNVSCLNSGEYNSLWFKMCMGANGQLTFTICPDDLAGNIDWAVYNATEYSCMYFNTSASLTVSCNSSSGTFPTNCTGPDGGPNPQDEPPIDVLAGETYYIVVNNYSQQGFTLNFYNSPIAGTDCLTGIENKTAPKLKASVYPNPATNTLILSVPGIMQVQPTFVYIYNTTGNLVKEVKSIDQPQTQIDIANLPGGLYYYTLSTINEHATGKFIKE